MTGWSPTVAEIAGRFAHASNATLLGSAGGEQVIYKPTAGARPLWDFDAGTLAAREVLTYRVSEVLGLDVVPETVIGDGPYGPGSVQRFVEVDHSFDSLALLGSPSTELWPIALLDIVVNNADRKAGHILKHKDGRLQAIDHGLTFHPEPKLRTVLWGFAGAVVPGHLIDRMDLLEQAFADGFGEEVARSTGLDEADALIGRARDLAGSGVHPMPPDDRSATPWPPV